MKEFWLEGFQRLSKKSPPYIVKLQLIMGTVATLGAGLAIIPWPAHWAVIGSFAAYLTAFSGGAVLFMSFAVKTLGIILSPGGSISNNSDTPVEVAPVAAGTTLGAEQPITDSGTINYIAPETSNVSQDMGTSAHRLVPNTDHVAITADMPGHAESSIGRPAPPTDLPCNTTLEGGPQS